MARVDFYHDAPGKLQVAVRLAQKALASGKTLHIATGSQEQATHIDRLLWTSSPLSFLPHAFASSPLAGETPIVIWPSDRAPTGPGILIHLGNGFPTNIDAFERIIEIVERDEDDKALARERFRRYRQLECQIVTHRLDPQA
jgi:DNA polymerase-3 subunit chi